MLREEQHFSFSAVLKQPCLVVRAPGWFLALFVFKKWDSHKKRKKKRGKKQQWSHTFYFNILVHCYYMCMYYIYAMYCAKSLQLCLTLRPPWTAVPRAPLSMGFSRQDHQSGLPFPPPGGRERLTHARHCVACGILVPWPGVEPVHPEMKGQNLNHWTTREVLWIIF